MRPDNFGQPKFADFSKYCKHADVIRNGWRDSATRNLQPPISRQELIDKGLVTPGAPFVPKEPERKLTGEELYRRGFVFAASEWYKYNS